MPTDRPSLHLIAVAVAAALLLVACSTRTETSRLASEVSDVARHHALACDQGEATSCYGLAHLYADDREERHHGLPHDPAAVSRLLARSCSLEPPLGCDGFREHQILQETRPPSDNAPAHADTQAPGPLPPGFPDTWVGELEEDWAPLVDACREDENGPACSRLAWGLATGATAWNERTLRDGRIDSIAGFQLLVRRCHQGQAEDCFFASHLHRDGPETIPQEVTFAESLWRHLLVELTAACRARATTAEAACRHLMLLVSRDPSALDEALRAALLAELCSANLPQACTLGGLESGSNDACHDAPGQPDCLPTLALRILQRDSPTAPEAVAARSALVHACSSAADTSAPRPMACQLLRELTRSGFDDHPPADCERHGEVLRLPTGLCPDEAPFLSHRFPTVVED